MSTQQRLMIVLMCLMCLVGTVMAWGASAQYQSIMSKDFAGTEITAWQWDKPEFCKAIEDYIKETSGVIVKGQTMSGEEIRNKIITSAAAGVGLADALRGGTYNVPEYVEIGAIRDLTELVRPYMHLLPSITWKMSTYKGKIWTVPSNSPAGGVFYRYDVLQKYGIDPRQIKTWDDFIIAGQKLVNASKGKVYMINNPAVGIQNYIALTIQQQFRAEIIGNDLTVKLNSDNWRKALELMQKIKKSNIGIEMEDWSLPWYQAIKDGTIAAFPSGTWFLQTIIMHAPDSKGKWYFTPFPAVTPGGDRYPSFGCASHFISSQTKKVGAVFEWIKAWALEPKSTVEIGFKQLGISIINVAQLKDPDFGKPHEYFALKQPFWRVAYAAIGNISYFSPVTPYDHEAQDIFNAEMEKWWLGKITTEAFLENTAETLKSKLGLK